MPESRLQAVFARILECPPNEREAALREHCAGDDSLLADCRRLLAALGAADSGGFLAAQIAPPDIDAPHDAPHDDPLDDFGERPGDAIGPYQLVEVIGEGGYGVVWLAERREPMVQRVALKIIKPGMDSRAVIARFRQERQALAVMDHPNIARVLDGGVTPTGRPYFVMELVTGEPITAFCDRLNLTIRDRLHLFTAVCAAVEHAHTKGVIHRDIKPSNILVGEHDGRPVPKVIDFGIAKAVSGALAGATVFTEAGQMIGTPEYMSPEQAGNAAPDDIDTRTDVYSLGVVLYELLTGSQPFDSNMLRAAGRAAIEKVIREVDPPRPSTRLSTLGEHTAEVAKARRTVPRELESQLRRELEWIPLKALRKDRRQRYRSAAELADDVQNYLAHRPLIAGPESAGYKARKFVRRNKGAVAAAGVIAASMMAASGISIWFGLGEAAARVGEEAQKTVAQKRQREAEASEAVARHQTRIANDSVLFLRGVFEQAHAEATTDDPPTIQQAVAIAVRTLDETKWSEPLVEAGVRAMFAGVLDSVGDAPGAKDQASLARAIYEQSGPSGKGYAEALAVLGSAELAEGNFAGAIDLYTQAIGVLDSVIAAHPDDSVAVSTWAATSCNLGVAIYQHTDLDLNPATMQARERAMAHLRETIARARGLGVRSDTLAAISGTLGQMLTGNQRDAEAEEVLRLAVADLDRDNPWHPVNASSHRSLAEIAERRGDAAEAEALYTRALEVQRHSLLPSSPDLADTLLALGRFLLAQNRAPEALTAFEESAQVREAAGDKFSAAAAMGWAAKACESMGDLDKAEAVLRRTDTELVGHLATSAWGRSHIRVRLASVLISRSQFQEAETILLDLVPSGALPEEVHAQLVRLYEAWDQAEPGKGYRAKADAFRKPPNK